MSDQLYMPIENVEGYAEINTRLSNIVFDTWNLINEQFLSTVQGLEFVQEEYSEAVRIAAENPFDYQSNRDFVSNLRAILDELQLRNQHTAVETIYRHISTWSIGLSSLVENSLGTAEAEALDSLTTKTVFGGAANFSAVFQYYEGLMERASMQGEDN